MLPSRLYNLDLDLDLDAEEASWKPPIPGHRLLLHLPLCFEEREILDLDLDLEFELVTLVRC